MYLKSCCKLYLLWFYRCKHHDYSFTAQVWSIGILKVLQFLWQVSGSKQYFLLLLIVSFYSPYYWISKITISIIVVMILRVYAMWNQSKKILFFLLCIYLPQIILDLVFGGVYYNPNTHLSGMFQVKLSSHAGGPSSTYFCFF